MKKDGPDYLKRLVRPAGLVCTIFLGLNSAADADQSAQDITFLTVDYPPFISQTDPEGGTVVRQLNSWIRDNGVPVRPVLNFLPPARAANTIRQGDWCASFYPPKNRSAYGFVKIQDRKVFIKLARREQDTAFKWSDLSEFRHKQIAMLRSVGPTAFADLGESGALLVFVDTIEQGMEMLQYGRVDYAMIDDFKYAEEYAGRSDEPRLQISETNLRSQEIGFFVGPNCRELFARFLHSAEKNAAPAIDATSKDTVN